MSIIFWCMFLLAIGLIVADHFLDGGDFWASSHDNGDLFDYGVGLLFLSFLVMPFAYA